MNYWLSLPTQGAVALALAAGSASGAVYDPRIVGLDVNQVIQEFESHTAPTVVGTRRTARYTGVTLREGRKTIVKVYANFPESLSSVGGFSARLTVREQTPTGFRTLGTLSPDLSVNPPLFQGTDSITLAQRRANSQGVFTFTLSSAFTGKPDGDGDGRYENLNPFYVSLFAELVTPPDNVKRQECRTSACLANNRLQVDDVRFVSICCPDVVTVKIIARNPLAPHVCSRSLFTCTPTTPPFSTCPLSEDLCQRPYYPEPRPIRVALGPVLQLSPVDVLIPDYRMTVDFSDILQRDVQDYPNGYLYADGTQSPIPCCFGGPVLSLLQRLKNDRFPNAAGIFGLYPKALAGGQGMPGFGWTNDDDNRPLTNIGHEFGHAFGRNHFSSACGGGAGSDPSEPDQVGLIQGIGLVDVGTPYRIITSPDRPVTPGVQPPGGIYDFMAYCAPQGASQENGTGTWIARAHWSDLARRFRYGGSALSALGTPPPPQLVVYGDVAHDGVVKVTGVSVGNPPEGYTPTPFRLVVRDAAGAVIADVPMGSHASAGHADTPPGERLPYIALGGGAAVAADLARRVEIVRDGSVVASRDRSASAPTGAFTAPAPGTTVGLDENVDIAWTASDPDGDPLEITVEWSREGGRPGTWRPVFLGPNGGSVPLPSDYFAGTGEGQLRLRMSDGFNETVVLSELFTVAHQPPRIEIVSPQPDERFGRRARIAVEARAFDERAQPLSDEVVWRAGRRRVGRGAATVLKRLPRGRHRLTATVTDPLTMMTARTDVVVRVR